MTAHLRRTDTPCCTVDLASDRMNCSKKRKRTSLRIQSFVATSFLLILADHTSAVFTAQSISCASFMGRSNGKVFKQSHISAFMFSGQSNILSVPSRHKSKLFNNKNTNGESKIGSTEAYLNKINLPDHHQGDIPVSNGDFNGESAVSVDSKNSKSSNIAPAEDDDYAMSIPKPFKVNDDSSTLPPNDMEEEQTQINGDVISQEKLIKSNETENVTMVELNRNSSFESSERQPFMANLIRNFRSPRDTDDPEDKKERAEESRRWSEWMTTGKKVRPSISTKRVLSDDAPAIVTEMSPPVDKVEPIETDNLPTETAEKVASPTKMLAKFKEDLSRKKLESELQQQKRKQEQMEKQQIERKQKQREERQYREQKEKDPGRISASDWSHNILNLVSSRILRDIRSPVLFSCLWASFWSVIYKSLIAAGESANTKVADLASRAASSMVIPTTAHSVMVSAMSLLLVFRTNSAYQRFAEGRKIWEDIVSTSRDFSRMVKLYELAIGTPKCRRIRLLIASFPYLLRHRIRPSLMQMKKVNDLNFDRDPENSLLLYPDISMKDTDPEIAALAYDEEETGSSRRKTRELCWVDRRTLPWKLLPGTALDLCARAQNRPLWVVDRMAKELCVVEDLQPMFTNRERMALMAYTDKLSRSIGACERIHQTVVPLNYARHALRSVTVWLWTLPFALMKDLGLLTGPIIAIIAWILFGVYEIGTRIEDPFQGTLRLSIYCDAIRRDVLADAIVRDTAFDLDSEAKETRDVDDDEDAIFEFESDSDEYGEAVGPSVRKKAKIKKDLAWFQNIDNS